MASVLRLFAPGAARPRLQDPAEIDRTYRRARLSVLLSITIGYGIAYTCRLGLSVVKKPLIDGGIFTAEQLGIIGSAIFYGYALGKCINGFLADHANIRIFWPTGVLISALLNIAMGWSTVLWISVVLWALNGWFQGFGAPSGVVAMTQWFSHSERGRIYGIWSTAHSLGEGLTFVGLSALVTWFGWRGGFIGPGVICVFVALILYSTMRDRPETLGLPPVNEWKNERGVVLETTRSRSTWQVQLSILKLPAVWILGLACATMTMTRYAVNSWGMLFFQETKGYSDLQAGALLALNPLAGIVGCVAYGFVSDKLFHARRPPVNLICGLLEIGSLLVIFTAHNPLVLTAAFLVYGLSINGLITSLGGLFAVDIVPKRAAGAVMGFLGIFGYVGAAIQERVSGYLIQRGTYFVDGVRHYDFSAAVTFWIGASVVSLILATSLWRARPAE